MLLIRIVCKAIGCYVLVTGMLLPVSVEGQTLTREELLKINGRLEAEVADTTRVRLLLAISAHASTHAGRGTARDSALQFAQAAYVLSTKIGYDSGIYRAYLSELALWTNVYHWQAEHKQNVNIALEKKREVQVRFLNFVKGSRLRGQLGDAYMAVADLYQGLGAYYEELSLLYDSAAACFRRNGNKSSESEALYNMGLAYNSLGKLKESVPIYHRSIALAEPAGGTHLYRVYGILGRTYSHLGGYNVALKYELMALRLAEAAGDTTDEMGAIHLFLGLTYSKLENHALARNHFEKAYRIDRYYTAHHASEFFAAALNLVRAKARTNPQESINFLSQLEKDYKALITPDRATMVAARYMGAYMGLHDYDKAQIYCRKLMNDVSAKPNDWVIYMSISEFLIRSGQYHMGKKYLARAEQISIEEKRMSNLPNIYLNWSKADSAEGNYAEAFKKIKLYKAYSDSMLNDIKTKEIALLETEYQTAKKEQSIVLLRKDAELAHQQLTQSRLQKNVFLAGLAVALIISALSVNQYLIKKKSNIELTRKQQEIQTTNEILQKTVVEKEWLLKEVHHRVKNNLQTVVSLLGSQLYFLQSTEAAAAINDTQNRVHTMSLIHQKLYQTEHTTSINMASYLGELTEYLRDSFPTSRMAQFQLDIGAIELDVSQAIPVGLILNEAITNAIKHAFSDVSREHCRVVISMHKDHTGLVLLSVEDNGRGLPTDFDSSGAHFGMGLRLIHGLVEEIDGTCKVFSNNNHGVSIEITFNDAVLLK